MSTFIFERSSDEDVIVINAIIKGKYEFRLALDKLQHIPQLIVMFYIFPAMN